MLRINILTRGFATPNGRAFLFPLVVHQRALRDAGLDIRFVGLPAPDNLADCDLLFIESRVFSQVAAFREMVKRGQVGVAFPRSQPISTDLHRSLSANW